MRLHVVERAMGRVWRLEFATRKTVQVFRLYTFVMSLKCSAQAKTRSLNSIILLCFITSLTRPTLNSIRQTDVDTLMIRTQGRVRARVWVRVWVRVIYLNQTSIRHQILGGVGVRVMHSRSDAPNPNPTHSILNCFFP